MLEAKWIKLSEENMTIGTWNTAERTDAMQVPGAVIVKHTRIDTINDNPTTVSVTMCVVPQVILQEENDSVGFVSSLREMTADMSKVMTDTFNKNLKPFSR